MNQELKKQVLFIDTSDNRKIILGLQLGEKNYQKKQNVEIRSSKLVLPMIVDFLTEHRISLSGLSEIMVNEGPGSFTGIRVGVSIANALCFTLGIPLNGKKDTFVVPIYQ